MTQPVPEQLRIGHLIYGVIVDQNASNEQSVRDRADYAGHSSMSQQKIILAETNNSGKPLGPDYVRETLLHEVLHCCLRVSACDPDADAKAQLPDVEERAVAAIAGPLLAALRDNPGLLAYLLAAA